MFWFYCITSNIVSRKFFLVIIMRKCMFCISYLKFFYVSIFARIKQNKTGSDDFPENSRLIKFERDYHNVSEIRCVVYMMFSGKLGVKNFKTFGDCTFVLPYLFLKGQNYQDVMLRRYIIIRTKHIYTAKSIKLSKSEFLITKNPEFYIILNYGFD